MDNNFDILEQAIRNLSQGQAPEGPSDELIRRTLERVEQVNTKPNPFVERILKMKPLSKFAAAAIVVVSISLLFLFNSGPQSVALADVYSKVQQVHAFMYKMSMTMSGMGEMMGMPDSGPMQSEGEVLISTEYGMKMVNRMQVPQPGGVIQSITQQAYMLPGDKIIVSIMPEQKTFQKIELTGEMLEQTQKQNNDPRQTIRRMMECEYVTLGQSEINGVKVQGFETTDPAYSGGVGEVRAVLWVDVDTWLPVRSEVSGTVGEKMSVETVVTDFQWNIPVNASDFAYQIPADYKDMGSMKMPEMTPEAAIEGLKLYKDLFNEYPERVDMASLVPLLMKNMAEMLNDPKTEAARAFVEKMKAAKASGDQAVMHQSQQETAPIAALAVFHMKLVQDKRDPTYYGDRVTPEDTDAVLMRWKTDSGKYMVVFGDLSSVEMEYEDMIKIEPPSETQDTAVPQ